MSLIYRTALPKIPPFESTPHLKYPYQYTKFVICRSFGKKGITIFDGYYKSNLKFHILNPSSTFRMEVVPGVLYKF
jgi:hypothetical protein